MHKIDYSKIKSIHFVGIKGVGMTPLSIIAKEAEFGVTGSDLPDVFITDEVLQKANIVPWTSFQPDHISLADLVITTGAHGGFDNPEVKAAKERGIPVLTQGEAVGVFMHGEIFKRHTIGISIAGCHGKTTTSAMIATLFAEAGLDPSYAIGTSAIIPLGSSGHYGRGDYFIAEADEYATEPTYNHTPKFLWQHPRIGIITNIEHDHPDLYPTMADVRNAYVKFAKNSDTLIVCGDDKETRKLLKEYHGTHISYGFSSDSDYRIGDVRTEQEQTNFEITTSKVSLGRVTLHVFGEHNALNATAALIVGLSCGLPLSVIKKGLGVFTGTKRRFEIIGKLPTGALLMDDYAHHPTEIKKTLKAARELFPGRKLLCIFQPHTYSRTKLLFEEFCISFTDADEVILTNIYPSARELPDPSVSSQLLSEEVQKFTKQVLFLPELANVVKYIQERKLGEEYVVITMGAGDVYKIADNLL